MDDRGRSGTGRSDRLARPAAGGGSHGGEGGRRGLIDGVVEALTDRIIEGQVAPGDTLPGELELAAEFGISRTTVREALRVLSTCGLIEARRRIGTVVQSREHWNLLDATILERLGRWDGGAPVFREMMAARLAFEPPIAGLAAEGGSARDAAALEAAVEAMAAALPDDVAAFAEAELEFHMALVGAAHNRFVELTSRPIRVVLKASSARTVRLSLSHDRMIAGYRRVSEAVRLRDASAATNAMTALLATFRDEAEAEPAPRLWPGPASRLGGMPAPTATQVDVAALERAFVEQFGRRPAIVRAPGRVNLIGEHTDYNGGWALPLAIERGVWAAVAPRGDRKVVLRSGGDGRSVTFDLDDRSAVPLRDWSDYGHGVALALERAGHRLVGADLLISGTLPLGGGLGSSAALEVAIGYGLLHAAGIAVDPLSLARACQSAENDFVGLRCGIMDQYASCMGVAGHALSLDCRQMASRPILLPGSVAVVVCNTMVRHELTRSAYNERRRECERGVAILSTRVAGISSLGEMTADDLEANRGRLPEVTYRCCRHVISENARARAAAAALEAGDFALLGDLMVQSHRSSRDDFDISCRELDVMVEAALSVRGVYGARLTGGGFGGCTVNLVATDSLGAFLEAVPRSYRAATGIDPMLFTCLPADGAGLVGDGTG